jgi:hypothetical protein
MTTTILISSLIVLAVFLFVSYKIKKTEKKDTLKVEDEKIETPISNETYSFTDEIHAPVFENAPEISVIKIIEKTEELKEEPVIESKPNDIPVKEKSEKKTTGKKDKDVKSKKSNPKAKKDKKVSKKPKKPGKKDDLLLS